MKRVAQVIKSLPILRMVLTIRTVIRITVMWVALVSMPITIPTLLIAGMVARFMDPFVPVLIVGGFGEVAVPDLSV
jgi:hypothetical protein